MSLHIYLRLGEKVLANCPECGHSILVEKKSIVFSTDISYNFVPVSKEAGVYECIWKTRENKFIFAKDITDQLQYGLNQLKSDPNYFAGFDNSGEWATYKNFVYLIDEYLKACLKFPDSTIEVIT
jgi:hypothetical protein